MDIKFPEERDPFPKTLASACVSWAIALIIGLFLGNALGAFFGTDKSVLNTSTYTDRMSAAKTLFMDADQLDSYMNTALTFYEMDGLRLYSSRDGENMLAYYDGVYSDAGETFGETVNRSLLELMHTQDALYNLEAADGGTIDDVTLYNIAVEDQVVYYYLYYDEAGYVGIAYDHREAVLSDDGSVALPLTQNTEGDQGMWYIIYDLED